MIQDGARGMNETVNKIRVLLIDANILFRSGIAACWTPA